MKQRSHFEQGRCGAADDPCSRERTEEIHGERAAGSTDSGWPDSQRALLDLRRWVARHLPSWVPVEEIEDLFSEALTRALSTNARTGTRWVHALVLRIAYDLAVDAIRSRRRSVQVADLDLWIEPDSIRGESSAAGLRATLESVSAESLASLTAGLSD